MKGRQERSRAGGRPRRWEGREAGARLAPRAPSVASPPREGPSLPLQDRDVPHGEAVHPQNYKSVNTNIYRTSTAT